MSDLNPTDIPSLLKNLYHENRYGRAIALERLARLENPPIENIERYFELTLDEQFVETYALFMFRRLGRRAESFIIEKLSCDDPRSQAAAVRLMLYNDYSKLSSWNIGSQILSPRLYQFPEWACDPELIRGRLQILLASDSFETRAWAAFGLDEFWGPEDALIPIFIEVLQDAYQPGLQNKAALHLGRYGPAAVKAISVLSIVAHSEHPWTATAAKAALKLIQTGD